jgi:uncharacterized membrane protein YphA (DoxX/SURF4 family)
MDESFHRKILALTRIATGFIFLFFGEYKLASGEFAHNLFPNMWLHQYINGTAVHFYGVFLAKVVLPHVVFFGYLVGVVELFIGLCLITGAWVRVASILGVLHMINLTLATWWEPGHNLPIWRYFGAELDHLPLLFLFLIFCSSNAGQTWGVDGLRRPRAGFLGKGAP